MCMCTYNFRLNLDFSLYVQVEVRAFAVINGQRAASPPLTASTSVMIDYTAPQVYPYALHLNSTSGVFMDWSKAFVEDVPVPMEFELALGKAENKGFWDIADWFSVGSVLRYTFLQEDVGFDNETLFVVGIRATNQAGLWSSLTQDFVYEN